MLEDVGADDQLTLHTFCDASQSACAIVIFIRIEKRLNIKIHFVQAKSRIAPVKKMTIRRLELLVATIAARLTLSVLETLRLTGIKTYYWCDSSTILAWIQREYLWYTFGIEFRKYAN